MAVAGGFAHETLHVRDGLPKADEDRAGDDAVADVQLAHAGQARDGLDVVVIQGVSGIEAHAGVRDELAGAVDLLEFGAYGGARIIPAAVVEGVGIGAGVDLANREAALVGGLDLGLIGVDERADEHARLGKLGDDIGQPMLLARHIEPAFGGHLHATLGDEHRGVRLDALCDRDHLVGRGHLEVELDVAELFEAANVVILNVPAVLAEVNGDSVGPAELGLDRGPDGVGLVRQPRLPDRGDVVDVDAELDHGESVNQAGPDHKRPAAVVEGRGGDILPPSRTRRRGPSMSAFDTRLEQLKSDLVAQGDRVVESVLGAVDCFFDRDQEKASEVIEGDELIDQADIEIERGSIPLFTLGESEEHKIRYVLTIVKINNELERIADCAVNIAEVVEQYADEMDGEVPATFRVMANSVIGMVRDANRAFADLNVDLAEQVLKFDDTVDRFKMEIGLDAEKKLAAGEFSVSFAFRLRTVTAAVERVADHCTNICEQVIYLASGKIVRHRPTGWAAPELPRT
jgi:phosphate transport system protein